MTGGNLKLGFKIANIRSSTCRYLYGVVAIMESMWLLSSSSSLLKCLVRDSDSSFYLYWKGKCNPSSQSVEKTATSRNPQRNEEIWWLPVPWVSAEGLSEPARILRQKRHVANQVHEATMTINNSILSDMEIPCTFTASFPEKGHLKGMLFQRAVKHFVIQRRDSDNHLVIEDWASREMHYNQLQRAAFHGDPNEELKQYRCGKRHSYSQVLKQMFIEKVRFARYNMTLILLGKKQGTILDKIEALKGAVVLALEMEDDCTNSDKEKHGSAYFGEALMVVGNDEMTELVVDSGGSYHMTHRRDFLYDFKVVDGGSVQLGDNTTNTIKGTGKVKIQLHDGSSFICFRVKKKFDFIGWVQQLGPGVETGVHEVHDEKRVWFEVELQGAQRDREAEDFQVSNDAAVAQRRLEDKQPEEKTNMDSLVKEQEKVHLGIKVGANITVTGVPGQKGAEGNVAEKKKVKEPMEARKITEVQCLPNRQGGPRVDGDLDQTTESDWNFGNVSSSAVDTIAVYQNIKDGETIVSGNDRFQLGFFSPGNSKNRYLGIWFKNTSPHTVVWVANRETPLTNSMGIVKLDHQGILSIMNGGGIVIWSSNSSRSGTHINSKAQLLGNGNLVIMEENNVVWQSFDYPGDTFISGMKLGKDLITGREMYLTSWRSADDPSVGEYTIRFQMVKGKYIQVYIRKNSVIQTRIGPYDGIEFAGLPNYRRKLYIVDLVINQKEMYYAYTSNSITFSLRSLVTPSGKLEIWQLNNHNQEWMQDLALPVDYCDNYGLCGPYGSCSTASFPICACLEGFELINSQDLNPDNWTAGCRRSRALDCGPGEGFLKLLSMKLPDTQNALFDDNMSLQECEVACKDNCSCTAYANPNMTAGGVGCLRWFGDLIDARGVLEDEREVAVKRLAETSQQGLNEFKNEVICIAKLQHRNLVKLLGYCIHGNEMILIYEFMANKSLDTFIFDEDKSSMLQWPQRFHIINGMARGILYLHQDSRLQIIHRDLKAGNILLDGDMNPKTSDFGLARKFVGSDTAAKAKKVVGTYGYISPEYAVHGQFSIKSDVFSFGVLVLEIVSGKKNTGFTHADHSDNLLGHAWRLFKANRSIELMNASLHGSCIISEVLRSIHVGLLCVQHNANDRPTMLSVVLMLVSEGELPQPNQPAFFTGESNRKFQPVSSADEYTITQLYAR
ncbi:G-type lectin S-receptor-like serine/threonine-protein kinase [Tanacetum coccineum]|uniref:non-specific serine/threonine protein kinase n=1 Tax=Tanacetum coccineum TaxID=301880 RepID=A0ABQ5HGG5_9ASTR